MKSNRQILAGLVLAILIAVWFGSLSHRALVRPDEGRYAEIPREMVASGDWVTPRLNGIKYFEKPALQYWTTAASFEVFGEHDWSARLWPALTGFGGILLAWFTGRRLWGQRAGLLAAAILGSSVLYSVMSHVITLDMSLTFFLQVAWSAFLLAQSGDNNAARRWMLLAWVGLALAVLSKGLVALVLTGFAFIAYSVANRDFSPWKRFFPISGLALFLAIAAPWFVMVSLANPEFPHFFFIHEHFERFLTKEHHRYQPNWYFFLIYALGALPWVTLYVHALIKSWGKRVPGQFSPERFLIVWIVGTFAFFSVSSSKLPPYILPIFPALAMLAGKTLADLSRRAWLIHLGGLGIVALVGAFFAFRPIQNADSDYSAQMLSSLTHWLSLSSSLWLAGIMLAAALVWTHRREAAILALAFFSFTGSLSILMGHNALAPFNSVKDIAPAVPYPLFDVPFYSVNTYEQTLPFYIKRTVTLVNYQDEMEFGLQQEPEKWIPSVAEFKSRWLADHDAFAIMSINNFDELRAEGFPIQELARNQRYVIARKLHPQK